MTKIWLLLLTAISLNGCAFSIFQKPASYSLACGEVHPALIALPNMPHLSIIWLVLKVLGTIGLAAASGWCYRFGGSNNGIRWVREVGDGACQVLTYILWFGWSWWLILIMGSIWGISTYFRIKGDNRQENLAWWNWALVGLMFALVPLPWVVGTWWDAVHHPTEHLLTHWKGFCWRAIFIIPVTTLVQTFWGGNVKFSEPFRGIIQILSCFLFLIQD